MNKTDLKIAFLVTAGAGLQVMENLIPYPLPGLRVGFASIVTLYAINNLGLRAGFVVALLRPVAAAVAGGWLVTPLFFFSFSGSIASYFAMALIKKLSGKLFSNYGVSVSGSMAHVAAQLCLFALFTPPEAVMRLFPFLMGAAVLSGIITGYLVTKVEKADFIPDGAGLSEFTKKELPSLDNAKLTVGTSLKIAAVAVFTAFLIFVSGQKILYAILILTLTTAAVFNKQALWKSAVAVAPFLILMLFGLLTGGGKYTESVLKCLSFVFFSAAISGREKDAGVLTGIFSLLKPAEKIGIPVTRFYSILMLCMETGWVGFTKNAVARLLNPVTK